VYCWDAVHLRKGYARSLAEMLDEAVREDLGQDAYDAGDEDDSAMVNLGCAPAGLSLQLHME